MLFFIQWTFESCKQNIRRALLFRNFYKLQEVGSISLSLQVLCQCLTCLWSRTRRSTPLGLMVKMKADQKIELDKTLVSNVVPTLCTVRTTKEINFRLAVEAAYLISISSSFFVFFFSSVYFFDFTCYLEPILFRELRRKPTAPGSLGFLACTLLSLNLMNLLLYVSLPDCNINHVHQQKDNKDYSFLFY